MFEYIEMVYFYFILSVESNYEISGLVKKTARHLSTVLKLFELLRKYIYIYIIKLTLLFSACFVSLKLNKSRVRKT